MFALESKSIVFVISFLSLEFSLLPGVCFAVVVHLWVEAIAILCPVKIAFQDFVGNPALAVLAGIVCREAAVLCEVFGCLYHFIGSPEERIRLIFRVFKGVLSCS